MRLFILIPFFAFLCLTSTKAHGDLDLRIKAISSLIESFPDSASLYFNRGKLKFQHEEYQASITDIHMSMHKGFYNELQKIYLAKSLFKLKNYEEAYNDLNEFLADDPNNVVGLNLKGRILYAQQRYEASALSFEKVINLTIRSLPENYLEAAQAWNASGQSDKYQKMIDILTLGLKNLGPIVTLQNKLIETHLENNNGERAVELQLSIIDKTKRKETPYFKLAEMYLLLDKKEKAKESLLRSKSHLDKLPSRIRKNSAMKLLKQKIEQLITKLQ